MAPAAASKLQQRLAYRRQLANTVDAFGENGGEGLGRGSVPLSGFSRTSSRSAFVLSKLPGEREGIVKEMNAVLIAENKPA